MKSKLKNLLLTSVCLFSSASYAAGKISDIIVSGNSRVQKSTIINYLDFSKDSEFTSKNYDSSLKSLYSTNLFENIRINFNSGKLFVEVKEYPIVNKVEFNGNKKFGNDTLQKVINANVGSTLSNKTLQEDVLRIKQFYRSQGRYAVEVKVEVERLENNRSKIRFDIKEGPKTAIKSINFVGNLNYSNSDLKSVLLTKEASLLSFMSGNDTYDPERIEQDKNRLTAFYNSVGYAQFNVRSSIAELSPDKKFFTLIYTIDEGPRFFINEFTLKSEVEGVNSDKLNKILTLKKGEFYNSQKIEKIRDSILEAVQDLGYSQSKVDVQIDPINGTNNLNVSFVIKSATIATINRINITGNLKTHDSVIRREFNVSEGDVFDRRRIKHGEQEVKNLDFFESVKVETEADPNDSKKANINLKVQEKSTAQVAFLVGYDTANGIVGKINLNESNFIGTGNGVELSLEKYSRKFNTILGYTNNNFLNRDLSLGVNVFGAFSNAKKSKTTNQNDANNVRQNDDLLTTQNFGSSFTFGYDISENLHHNISYLIKRTEYKNATSNSQFVRDQLGKYTTSSISNRFSYIILDSKVVPKNGYILSVNQTLAGFGGNNKFLKHEVGAKLFKSFYNNNLTFKLQADAGNVTGKTGIFGRHRVRMTDRFSMGEPMFRGFDVDGVGPRVKNTEESLNGMHYYYASAEAQFPLGLPKEYDVRGVAFVDVGSCWGVDTYNSNLDLSQINDSKSPRVSVGLGFIWNTRFAPIRIDYGIPIVKKSYDSRKSLHIKLSTNL